MAGEKLENFVENAEKISAFDLKVASTQWKKKLSDEDISQLCEKAKGLGMEVLDLRNVQGEVWFIEPGKSSTSIKDGRIATRISESSNIIFDAKPASYKDTYIYTEANDGLESPQIVENNRYYIQNNVDILDAKDVYTRTQGELNGRIETNFVNHNTHTLEDNTRTNTFTINSDLVQEIS